MTYIYHNGSEDAAEGFCKLLEELQTGDCLAVEHLSCAAGDSASLLELLEQLEARGIRFRSAAENFDTGTDQGRFAYELLKKVSQLDHREKSEPREDSHAKGRKPIEVDEEMFDSILERWKSGEITARQAMAELNLKPNTFYRRVKERMPDATADSLLDAARKIGKGIVDTVAEGTEEFQQAAGKFAAEHDMSNISDTVKKNITAAGMVFSRKMDSLSKDFQDAMEKFEKKQQPPKPQEAPAEPEDAPKEAPATSEEPAAQPEEAAANPEETEFL